MSEELKMNLEFSRINETTVLRKQRAFPIIGKSGSQVGEIIKSGSLPPLYY